MKQTHDIVIKGHEGSIEVEKDGHYLFSGCRREIHKYIKIPLPAEDIQIPAILEIEYPISNKNKFNSKYCLIPCIYVKENIDLILRGTNQHIHCFDEEKIEQRLGLPKIGKYLPIRFKFKEI